MKHANCSSEFENFRALTHRILTTPKAELVKHDAKSKHKAAKPRTKKSQQQ